MMRAAELWAAARRAGLPTAGPDALDGDCILAAQALLSVGPSDTVTVASDNVAHLSRFVDARFVGNDHRLTNAPSCIRNPSTAVVHSLPRSKCWSIPHEVGLLGQTVQG